MTMSLNVLSSMILSKYFLKNVCLFIITDNFNNFEYDGRLPMVTIKLSNNQLNNYTFLSGFGCSGFVVQSDSPCELFPNIEQMIRYSDERFNERKYLILPGNNYKEANTMCMFELEELKYVNNVVIIIPKNEIAFDDKPFKNPFSTSKHNYATFNLITHKFKGLIYNEIVFLDKWFSKNESFMYNNNLFPDKITDQEGRAFRVTTITYAPYAVPDMLDGVELRLTNLYGKVHNMTVQMVVNETALWGEIYDDWTGDGILGNIVTDQADVGLGALYTWPRESHFLDLSRFFVRAGMTSLVPAPRLAAGWLTPVLAFSATLWAAVGITFIVIIFALFAALIVIKKSKFYKRYVKRNLRSLFGESVFNTVSLFVFQAVPTCLIPNNMFYKFVFGMGLLFGILLTSAYSSGLYGNMAVPKFIGEIRTVRDLIDSKMHWTGPHFLFIGNIAYDPHPDYAALVRRFDILTKEELHERAVSNKFGMAIERLPFGHYSVGDYIGEAEMTHLKPLKEDVYSSHCVFMTKKSSVLIPTLNNLISQIYESGILEFWEYSAVMNTMNPRIQKAVIHSVHQKGSVDESETVPSKLKFKHLSGDFALLALGLILSLVAFIFEIIVHRLT